MVGSSCHTLALARLGGAVAAALGRLAHGARVQRSVVQVIGDCIHTG